MTKTHSVTKTNTSGPKLRSIRRLASPRVQIPVTTRHISDAVRGDSSHCMIADAIKDALPSAKSISVDLQTIRWTDAERLVRYIFLTPRSAQVALIKFDQGETFPPFQVNLAGAQVVQSQIGTNRHSTRKTKLDASGLKKEDAPGTGAKSGTKITNKSGRSIGSAAFRRKNGTTKVREIIGGNSPPLGPLVVASSSTTRSAKKDTDRLIARRREFGLKSLRK